jgi:hypothetical protein
VSDTTTVPESPFQLNDSRHDPIGTTREERLDVGVNVWVYEDTPLSSRAQGWTRWRCLYSSCPNADGMPGQVRAVEYAAGFVPTGGVPGTPAAEAWEKRVPQLAEIPADALAEARRLIEADRWFNAVRVVRCATGWDLIRTRNYVRDLKWQISRDAVSTEDA